MTTENPNTQLKKFQEDTVNSVLNKINLLKESGELSIPDNYHVGNNLKLAWLYLQETKNKDKKPVLEACTQTSICNALLEMVIKGLSVAKKQGYFIAYGNTLDFQPSYSGNYMIAKRDANVADVNAQIIYDGDEYVTEIDTNGVKKLSKHIQKLENINIDKIKGAYAVVVFNDGKIKLEDMTIQQIRNAWGMGFAKGNSDAHKLFTDQMCKKTVINRALKIENNSSDDSEIEENPSIKARNAETKELANTSEVKPLEIEYVDVSNTTAEAESTTQEINPTDPLKPQPEF